MEWLNLMPKQDLMDMVEAEVKACRKCELWKGRRNPVLGEGNLNAIVMFIGEAPGYWEDVKGRPFVGAAGKFLDELLAKIGLARRDVYITNVLKSRPPENRDPQPSEIQACTSYLDRQIKIIQPKIIVTLGRHSMSYIISKLGFEIRGITGVHGRVYDGDHLGLKVCVIPTFHPASALYNPKYRDALERDFHVIKRELEKLEARLT